MPPNPPRSAPTLSPFRGEIRPLSALRFDPLVVEELGARIVPPGPSAARTGPERAPLAQSLAHTLFPPQSEAQPALPGMPPTQSMREVYQGWQRKGELTEDPMPSIYLHELEFTDPLHGGRVTRRGFFALLAVTEGGALSILPHEQTLPERVRRQVEIFRWRGAQVLPLFLLYSDPEGDVLRDLAQKSAEAPVMAFRDTLGQDNRLWRVDGPDIGARLSRAMGHRDLLIADGHHRFEATRRYWQEEGLAKGGVEALSVAFFTAAEDPGLRLGTFHRGLRGLKLSEAELRTRLGERYRVEAIPVGERDPLTLCNALLDGWNRQHEAGIHTPPSFVLAPRGLRTLYTAVCQHPTCQEDPARDRLDVSDLHAHLLPLLGTPAGVDFEEDPAVLMAELKAEEGPTGASGPDTLEVGIFLTPPGADAVWSVARAGNAMPPKATYFYPKLLAGLLHYPLPG